MKEYPSIPAATGTRFFEFDAHVFEKLDGQNFRAQWSKSRGFYKFGSRTRLVSLEDEEFGPAVALFQETLSEAVEKIALSARARSLMVYAEWHGERSFAGFHGPQDTMRLSIFEAAFDQKGWCEPTEFRKRFEDKVDTPEYLGKVHWTRGYVQRVREGLEESSFEGVVGKSLKGPRLIMAKAKTQAWLDRVHREFDERLARQISDS